VQQLLSEVPSSLFTEVKEFNLFSVSDFKVSGVDRQNDILTLELSKGQMQLVATV